MITACRYLSTFVACLALIFGAGQSAAQVPDLTQTIDFERNGEYYLGPTGAKGWIYAGSNHMTTDARQILITKVEPGSASEGKLQVGDVILGIGQERFSSDARKTLGHAILHAERAENKGSLKLIRWRPIEGASPRQGKVETVELKLEVMGAYSDTSPWDCPKTERIYEDAIKHLAAGKDFGRFGASALALLATGEQQYIDLVRDYIHKARWARPDIQISVELGGKQSWTSGYQNVLLTEYYLLTGDEYVLPAIREYAIKTAMGQSGGGTWGHGFAWTKLNDGKLHGRLPGYGALNSAGLPCYLSLILAKKCGIEHPEIDAAIARSSQFFGTFVGNGSIGYGYHRPSLEVYASGKNGMSGNGKNGIAAIAFRVKGDDKAADFFGNLTASLYDTCEYGHSGNSYSYYWDPLGANAGGPELAIAFLKELHWYYALTRMADGTFVNQPLGGHYGGKFLDPTAAQVLIAMLPRRKLYITGKGQDESDWLSRSEAQSVIDSGKWRNANTDAMSVDELVEELDSWSPIAREWVAKAIAKKDGDFVGKLVNLLDSDSADVRAGACAALGHLGERGVLAVPALSKALTDEQPHVCIAAGYALGRIGKAAEDALPDLLRAIIASEEPGLMRPKIQALAYAFGHERARTAPLYFEGVLPQVATERNPLEGIDRELLYAGITKLLNDPSGRTRDAGALAFRYFDREDAAAMAQQIYNAVTVQSEAYMMFEDAPRQHALQLMARFKIKEGLPLCFETFFFNLWGGYSRYPSRLKTLQAYAGCAKPYLPQIRELRSKWKSGEDRELLEQTIKIIEEAPDAPEMISLHDLVDERLSKDLVGKDKQERVAFCQELTKQHPADYFYQAAGLREIVAILGAESLRDVTHALGSPNEIYRDVAAELAAGLPGTSTQTWVKMLPQSDGWKRVGVLRVLGHRADPTSAGPIRVYLEDPNPAVQAAAEDALERLE